MPKRTLEERFWEKVDKSGQCWVWTASHNTRGYGWFAIITAPYKRVGVGGVSNVGGVAHRVAWHMLRGPIPEGMDLDHLCRNRLCVNPDHLEPVTRRENVLRGIGPTAVNARKTVCKRGHSLDDAYVYNGSRNCRTCTLEKVRLFRAKGHGELP